MSRPPCRWVFILLLATVPAAMPVSATTIDLSWDHCAPVVMSVDAPQAAMYAAYVSAIGQAEPQQGFEFWIVVRSSGTTPGLPDAWRFDPGGCQGPEHVAIDHFSPVVLHSCLNYQGASASLQIKSYQAAPEWMGPGFAGAYVVVLANAYPAGSNTTNPAQRWFLGRVLFDHTKSVTGDGVAGESCGGFERAMCLGLLPSHCNWVDMKGEAHAFALGQWGLTFGDPQGTCLAQVPARSATWGAIKGIYRQ